MSSVPSLSSENLWYGRGAKIKNPEPIAWSGVPDFPRMRRALPLHGDADFMPGRSSDSRIIRRAASSRIASVTSCGVRPRLQRRARLRFARSSLFIPWPGNLATKIKRNRPRIARRFRLNTIYSYMAASGTQNMVYNLSLRRRRATGGCARPGRRWIQYRGVR